jgi:lysine 2,3-aminomutase
MVLKNILARYPEEAEVIRKVQGTYPIKVNDYYLGLIREKGDAIWKQALPDMIELEDNLNEEDPLQEEECSPVPCLVHRYPDRVLLLASNKCAMYCRFCTRKRKVGKEVVITQQMIANAINYIRKHNEIRDVIVSGGDPLMLADAELEYILKSLRGIPHVEVIRIGTRIPCTYPMRVTRELASMISKYHPVYVNVHFNHPREITKESRRACALLADAGIPLGNQTVLLKGVNDDAIVLKELFQKLVAMRVRPYYIYQADLVKGTEHFRTDVQDGLKIMEKLQGFTSGLCIPQFMIDPPGGGKIPISSQNIVYQKGELLVLRNFEGKIIQYYNPKKEVVAMAKQDVISKMAVVFNLKKVAEQGLPEDYYAEYDDISIPLAIKSALEKKGYEVDMLEANDELVENLKKGGYGFVFNMAEGIGMTGSARESQVPAILDMLGIPYSGSGVLTQAITLDKARTKEILDYHRVPTARYQLFTGINDKLNPNLRFPLFVKPNAEGSSKGIRNNSLVKDEKDLKKIVKWVIDTYHQPALVEEYLDGREFTVAILGNANPKVLPIVEVTFDYLPKDVNKFDSYEVKWMWDSPNNPVDPIVCPAKIDKALQSKIEEVALKAYKVLGVVDYCRMDIRLDRDGVPNIIELNAIPGLMPDPLENSRFPKSCYALGMSYEEIVYAIVSEAMRRNGYIKDAKRLISESRNIIQLSR